MTIFDPYEIMDGDACHLTPIMPDAGMERGAAAGF
jgi:hypothetical protein